MNEELTGEEAYDKGFQDGKEDGAITAMNIAHDIFGEVEDFWELSDKLEAEVKKWI